MLSYSDFLAKTDIFGVRLNPCSNGICSLTVLEDYARRFSEYVLILVLMEYALLHKKKKNIAAFRSKS